MRSIVRRCAVSLPELLLELVPELLPHHLRRRYSCRAVLRRPTPKRIVVCRTVVSVLLEDHGGVEIRPGIGVADEALAAFAQRHAIRRLAAFGSVLRDDFRPDSDVDVLVEFVPGRVPGLLAVAAMELELGDLIGRKVELRTYAGLSRFFRDHVRDSARDLYCVAVGESERRRT